MGTSSSSSRFLMVAETSPVTADRDDRWPSATVGSVVSRVSSPPRAEQGRWVETEARLGVGFIADGEGGCWPEAIVTSA
ncbi:hypothetical protein L2E82_30647 [Cichorium intybus]|uniref:Uncharacterized protein n=1 Tax=Cichorium intybus TaxID=13427 RepID=A0ACB9D1F2_CICIN|nr:hypothetical protein L2E82_30647 [Cichorium intybus]